MVSSCPKCQTKIEHEDFLFEVLCGKCGCRFNPFMQLEGAEAEAPVEEPGLAEPVGMGAADSSGGFQESNATFQELRDFGENLGSGGVPQSQAEAPAPKAARREPAEAPVFAAGNPVPIAEGEECVMVSGDTLAGYRVESYLAPVSAMAELADGDPLSPAFQSLWKQARRAGGNAVVGVRWLLTPDATRVLVSGTPVRCSRG